MEARSTYILAKRVINIIYVYEKSVRRNISNLSFEELAQGLADVFYIYDRNNKLLNGTSFDTDVQKQAINKTINETASLCMINTECDACCLQQIREAVTSINLTHEKHIRGTDILKTCNTVYFLVTHKFRPKINTDDWENI